MEIIVGIAVVAAIGYLIFRKPEPVPEGLVAPYKVETPESKVEEINSQPVTKTPAAKKAPAKKAPAAKKPAATKKAPAKKPAAAKKAPAKTKAAK